MEYIFGGCQINLHVAIDFTGSNGPASDSRSLHSLANIGENQYIQAMRAVGKILQYYDSDKAIPAYGFGGYIQNFDTYHKFALNGDCFKPECEGIEDIENYYMNTINKVQFSAPTNFAPIIGEIVDRLEQCEVSQWNQEYHVLMIMTDGAITDLQNTIDQIVRGSSLNLSIIIVGVGNYHFREMDQLDADTTPLHSRKYGKYMARDIVQFVPYNKFKHDPLMLAKEVLAELPKQVTDFFISKGIEPNAAKESERAALRA